MITKKIYILYQPGSYGSYLRWIIDYCNDVAHKFKSIPNDPTADDGSAHYFPDIYNKHICGEAILKTIEENPNVDHGYMIHRVLPIIHGENIKTDEVISYLSANKRDCDKLIYIDVDTDYLKELTFINIELKADYKPGINFELGKTLHNWGYTTTDFFEIDRWAQREILSLWFRGMINSLTKKPKTYDNVLHVDMHNILFGSAVDLAKELIEFCDLPFRDNIESHISNVHNNFISKQKALIYHKNMLDTVQYCLRNEDAQIGEMSLFTEAILQEQLLKNGYALKCYNLNILPKTTGELIKLLEKC